MYVSAGRCASAQLRVSPCVYDAVYALDWDGILTGALFPRLAFLSLLTPAVIFFKQHSVECRLSRAGTSAARRGSTVYMRVDSVGQKRTDDTVL